MCAHCDINEAIDGSEFCSPECDKDFCEDYELYLEWYNDYMAGYDVPSFEKIIKRKREEA